MLSSKVRSFIGKREEMPDASVKLPSSFLIEGFPGPTVDEASDPLVGVGRSKADLRFVSSW